MIKQISTVVMIAALVSAGPVFGRGPGTKERVGVMGNNEARGLEENRRITRSQTYVCPKNCAQSDKAGKCPRCGMQMKKVEPRADRG